MLQRLNDMLKEILNDINVSLYVFGQIFNNIISFVFVQCTRLVGKRVIMSNDEIFNRDSLS